MLIFRRPKPKSATTDSFTPYEHFPIQVGMIGDDTGGAAHGAGVYPGFRVIWP